MSLLEMRNIKKSFDGTEVLRIFRLLWRREKC